MHHVAAGAMCWIAGTLGFSGSAATVAGGAMAAAAGSIASQAVGVATGIQDKFSWKDVGLAAISGGVGSVGEKAKGVVQAIIKGATRSAISQGIAVTLGLQDKFSWAAVAAAGVGAGVGQVVGRKLGSFAKSSAVNSFIAKGITGGAAVIAAAVTQSALDGTDFGDGVALALPSMIGSIIGEGLASLGAKSPVQMAVLDGEGRQARRSDASHTEVVIVTAQRKTSLLSLARDFFGFDGRFGLNRRYDVSLNFATPFNAATFGANFAIGRNAATSQTITTSPSQVRSNFLAPVNRYIGGIGQTYQNRVNSGVATMRAGGNLAQTYSADTSMMGPVMRGAGLLQAAGGLTEYGLAVPLTALDVVIGRPARTLSGNTLPETFMGDAVLTIGGALTLRPRAGVARTPSLEAQYQARYMDAYERGVIKVDADIAKGVLNAPATQPAHLFRANRIDDFARQELKAYALEMGHGDDLVRVNKRLYLNGVDGKYRIPDLYFPQSQTIFDGTLGTKSLNTPQIIDFRIATGNMPIGIVRPDQYGGPYRLGQ